jgi:hypothetical protein
VILRLTDANTDKTTGAIGFVHPQYSTRCSAASIPDPGKPGFYRIMVSYSAYVEVNLANSTVPQLLTPQSIAFSAPAGVGEFTSAFWSGLTPGLIYATFSNSLCIWAINLDTGTIITVLDCTPFLSAAAKYGGQPTGIGMSGLSWNDDLASVGWWFTDDYLNKAPQIIVNIQTGQCVATYSGQSYLEYDKPNLSRDGKYFNPGNASAATTIQYALNLNTNSEQHFVNAPNLAELSAVNQHGANGQTDWVQGLGYINPENANVSALLRRSFASPHEMVMIASDDRNTPITGGTYFSLTSFDQSWATQCTLSSGYTGYMDGEIMDIAMDGSGQVCRYCHHFSYLLSPDNYNAHVLPNKSFDGTFIVFTSNWMQPSTGSPPVAPRSDIFLVMTGQPATTRPKPSPVPIIDAPAYGDQTPLRTAWPQSNPANFAATQAITIPAAMLQEGGNLVEIAVPFQPYGYSAQPGGILVECSQVPSLQTPGAWQWRNPNSSSCTSIDAGGTLAPVVPCVVNVPSAWMISQVGAGWVGVDPGGDPWGTGYSTGNSSYAFQCIFSCGFCIEGQPPDIQINLATCTYMNRIKVNGVTIRVPSQVASLPDFQSSIPYSMFTAGPDLSWQP